MTPHFRNYTPFSFSISLHSSFMIPAAKPTTPLMPPHTDQQSTSDFVKLRLDFGFHLLMTYSRLTLTSSNNPHQRNPLGKQNVPEQLTNPFPAAGRLPSAPSKKTTARPHLRKPSTKSPRNSFAPRSLHKNRTSFSPLLPKPGALATNTLPKKSHTGQLPTACDNSGFRPIQDALRLAIRTLPPCSKHPMAFKLPDFGS